MPANPAPMVPPRPGACQHRLASVTGADAPSQTASTVERTLFRRRATMDFGHTQTILPTAVADQTTRPQKRRFPGRD
jgi:hypothetical protein